MTTGVARARALAAAREALALLAPLGACGRMLPARVRAVRAVTSGSNAVYAAFDVRGDCRYVGSVARSDGAAVADRLAEHFRAHPARSHAWHCLAVLALPDRYDRQTVRAAEGWAARVLNPVEGTAHPQVDLLASPEILAATD